MLRSNSFRRLVEAEQVVQRVVERAQVRIDLLREVAGQEAQALAGLDRRAHQHDPLHRVAFERIDRAGDGEVGLAGAGRADAERDVVLLDVLEIERSGCGVRPCRSAPGACAAAAPIVAARRRRARGCVASSTRPSWMSSTDSGFSACA